MGGGLTRTSLRAGFTIVELLIVIIVIAILAMLVITAYNGVQQKANNTKTADAVQAYKKALIEYATEHGQYPITSGNACLGDEYPGDHCWRNTGWAPESATVNSALRPYLGGSLPMPSTATIHLPSNWDETGATFFGSNSATIDGAQQKGWILYVLQGNTTKCPVGPIAGMGSWPVMVPPPAPLGYTQAYADGTTCWIPMPDPASL